MIIDFTIENFRSIKAEQTLSMLATASKEHGSSCMLPRAESKTRLLKSALIHGANASGKSNIIKAFSSFRHFVLNATELKLGDKIPCYEPFRLDRATAKAPTRFDLEFIAPDGLRYQYIIAFNQMSITHEELTFYPKGQPARLFLREQGKKIQYGEYLKGKKRSIEEQLLENCLFLSKAANSRNERLSMLYLYIKDMTVIESQRSNLFSNVQTSDILYQKLEKHEPMVRRLLQASDLDIMDLTVDEEEHGFQIANDLPMKLQKLIKAALEYRIKTSHKVYEQGEPVGLTEFDLEDESEGTQKLYQLLGPVVHRLAQGGLLVIDELDNCLHPLMSAFLIDLFHDPAVNVGKAQIIATSHDSSLLNPELFRRDQLWFTEKDGRGATKLFSLAEFSSDEVRKDTPFDAWYLVGRFGALPLLNRSSLGGYLAKEAQEKYAEA